MAATPITLTGANLGQRHRHFNCLVADALSKGILLPDAENLPENSPLDRLYKIDLASKLKNVDYIIRNLKDDDMLYVSRSLKATWLLDPQYRSIMNPKYLDEELFPRMIGPAISKMRHWLYINLRDPGRCAEFYEHYKQNNMDVAIKFLCNCTVEYILEEFPKILPKITPHYLKIFTEKSSKFAKIYFDAIYTDMETATIHRANAQKYYNSIKCVLKSDPDVFLDITEKTHEHKDLGPGATEYIVKHCKQRFMDKAELYTANLLHMPTIAKNLSVEECQQLVLRLARANYLNSWFSYENVEPLVKRLSPDRRAAFKKRVFVDKDVGDRVDEWPYPTPKAPVIKTTDLGVFKEIDIEPPEFPDSKELYDLMGMEPPQFSYCCARMEYMDGYRLSRPKTELDRLFDEYRFIGFDRAFRELSRRIGAAGNLESRRNLLLVLVSKSGGRAESVAQLLGVLARHASEPGTLRAALVRSLVRRARAWRLPAAAWAALRAFGHGLGLDGGPAEVECREGLHAVILRHLLSGTECEQAARDAFLGDFSTLSDYSLAADERPRVVNGLTRLLTTAAEKSEPKIAASHLQKVLEVYKTHKFRVDRDVVVPAARLLAGRDLNATKDLLSGLYEDRVARKELFLFNFALRQDAASYLNVLRHDPSAFSPNRLIEQLVGTDDEPAVNRGPRHFDRFTEKLSLYFSEDLALQFLSALKAKIAEKPDVRLARPLASVIGGDMNTYLETFDTATGDIGVRRLAAALRACSSRCRPQLDIDAFELKNIGAKAVAARVLAGRQADVEKNVNRLLSWRRTARVAIVLAQRTGHETDAFAAAAKLRPLVAIKTALSYFRRRGDNADFKVWEIVKPLIQALNVALQDRIYKILNCARSMPATIRYDYIVTVFFTLIKNPNNRTMMVLHRDLEEFLPDINKESIEKILLTLLEKKENIKSHLYPSIFIRYLLLCETEEEQINRFKKIGRPFLERVDTLPRKTQKPSFDHDFNSNRYYNSIRMSLKYNRVCFDTKYVSCLPVCENIIAWMKKKLPMERYFNGYVDIHLTMLYFKAVRQSIQEVPEVFKDPKRKIDEGASIIGITFGKYIAKELRDLMSTYFDSIVELYKRPFKQYLTTYFRYNPHGVFTGAVIKGIIVGSVGSEFRLGVYMIDESDVLVNKTTRKEIKEILGEKSEMGKFFLYASSRLWSESLFIIH